MSAVLIFAAGFIPGLAIGITLACWIIAALRHDTEARK